ncbi:MAG TPA: acyl-CoA dehydrogenase, partial [Acidimicrobiia bacterium]
MTAVARAPATPPPAAAPTRREGGSTPAPGGGRAAAPEGFDAIRAVRSRADYEAWYPVFGAS